MLPLGHSDQEGEVKMLKALTSLLIAGAAALAIASPAAADPICTDGYIYTTDGGVAKVDIDQYCDGNYYVVDTSWWTADWYRTGTGFFAYYFTSYPEVILVTVAGDGPTYAQFYLTVYYGS